MSADAPQGVEISIATPGDWIDIDPERYSDEAMLHALADERLAEIPELAPFRDNLIETMAQTLGRAREDDVVFCAIQADLTDSEQPLVGSLTVAITAGAPPDPDREVDPTMADLEIELEAEEPDVSQRVVTSMLLPGGPTVRIARIVDLPIVEGEGEGASPKLAMSALSVQYFFGVPDENAFVVLNFASPTLGAHLRLQAEWHDIAQNFRFAGQPIYVDDAMDLAPDGDVIDVRSDGDGAP